jgi:glyoxylase-like metal-dependent hydrolase (beta-lactamase superfamily II)
MTASPTATRTLDVLPLLHPQGCRTYLVSDPTSRQALAVDVHLDLVEDVVRLVRERGWSLPYVVDTHTHADHPSGSGELAARFSSTRIAHERAHHRGVARHPRDGETLHLGDVPVTVRHAPGHTPDHMVLTADGILFSGDTLLIGAVARTDFLGGDAGTLHDTIHRLLADLPDDTVLYPGHDYAGRSHSTLGEERARNPWLAITDRDEFVRLLTADPPPRPANMDDLLRLNREGVDIPASLPAAEAAARVKAGGATSVVDVRTGSEFESEHVPGSRLLPLDQVAARADEVRATPAPRLLLCRTDSRARMAQRALSELGISALTVIEGGIEAYRAAGGATVRGRARMSIERQVRLIAGSIALGATLLGLLVHPAFLGLTLFVAAGQVFAGLTDWCGMALLLGRMPWNRASGEAPAGPAGGCAASAPGGCAATAPPIVGGCAAGAPPEGDRDR